MAKHLPWIFVVLFFLPSSAFSQIGIRIFDYRPTGEFGFVMKPLVSTEISFIKPFDDDSRWRADFSITFLKMKPRLDTFPITTVEVDGNTTTILPGVMSFQKYSIIEFMGGVDFAFIKKDPFTFFAGMDLIVGAAAVDYTDVVPTYKDESYSGGGYLGGMRFRLGGEYSINDRMGISITANRSVFLVSEPAGIYAANDYGIGFRYSWK